MASMEELNTANQEKWGIDRKIPIAIIGVVIFQTLAITWGAATFTQDVKNYGEKTVKLEENFDKFVEKAEVKYESRASHNLDKQHTIGEIADIKKDIETLEGRIRWLEKNLK